MKTIALYARVSSEQQARQATVDSQIAALRERAEGEGHAVLPDDVYVDEGSSGSTLLRPALERLRDRAAQGGLDQLYVHCPDRLARRYAYQALLLDELSSQGVSVEFIHGPTGTTAEDDLLVQVQGIIAEYERAKILERSRRGKLHRARQGLVNPLSGAPYGYVYVPKSDGEPARYEVLLHEAKVVRQVFEWLVHEQRSIGEITRMLNAQGVPTRRGAARWERSTVWGVLRNPAYMGKAAYGKTQATEARKLLRPVRGRPAIPRRPKGASRSRPEEEWIYVDVPRIVSAELFEAAKEQLERNRRLSQKNGRGKRYLLQGLVVCAKCGYAFYGKTTSRSAGRGKRRYVYYRCTGTDGYRFAGGRICDNGQVRADQLDGYVWESVQQLLQDPARLQEEWARRGEDDGAQGELRRQRDEAARFLAAQDRTLRRLLDAYEAGALELDDLTERSRRVRARATRARAELEAVEARLAGVIELREVIARLDGFAARVDRGLDELTWDERRQLVRTLVARVEIDEDGATIVYRLPPAAGTAGSGTAGEAGTQGSSGGSSPLCTRRDHAALR